MTPDPPPTRRRVARFVVASVALTIALLAIYRLVADRRPTGVALPAAAPRAGAKPVMWPAPQFSLPDQDDATVSTADLRGRVWIVDFIFTRCGNTCPKMTARREQLLKQIADPRVMFLSISVDPEGDDRATRKSYTT